ncbi:hypothetical protein KPH14_005929 [Odynerus spinipes]|uniref:Uncharacterized protein n=1 Tax=Odynerus spinipes TaxID=1348599 RepID=A0AAD9RJD8_9HYME|nr:hypothetical protein KPH14_005929 [Odynerus spinipes]
MTKFRSERKFLDSPSRGERRDGTQEEDGMRHEIRPLNENFATCSTRSFLLSPYRIGVTFQRWNSTGDNLDFGGFACFRYVAFEVAEHFRLVEIATIIDKKS